MQVSSNEHSVPLAIKPLLRPYKVGTTFVRLYDNVSIQKDGQFIVLYGLIEGKTPEEIQSKLALTFLPKFLCIANPDTDGLQPYVLHNEAGHEVRVFQAKAPLILTADQPLYSGTPVHLMPQEKMANGLRLTLSYITQSDELFIRIYDQGRQPMRGAWVFAFRHAAGKTDAEIAELFHFLNFSQISACNVVVPAGIRVKGWAPPDSDDPYIYEIEDSATIEFIDDRLLLPSSGL